jgi:hypothetical protein
MNSQTKEALITWIKNLDIQIGDTDAEIRKRREYNADAVKVRDDLDALIRYMQSNALPDEIYRALNYCLNWNPFTKSIKDD